MSLERVAVSVPAVAGTWSDHEMALAVMSRSEATRRAYASDLNHFREWCSARQAVALPATVETVRAYVAHLAQRFDTDGSQCGHGDGCEGCSPRFKPATITRRLAAISVAHQLAGLESPTRDATVRAVLTGARRSIGMAQREAAPVGTIEVRRIVARMGDGSLTEMRDRAILLAGLALAARRSELVGLDVEHLEKCDEGYRVTISRSKTDQEGRGAVRALVYGNDPDTCPVRALERWLAAAAITSGPVFRKVHKGGKSVSDRRLTGEAVSAVVKARAPLAGLDPSRVSGHSLRAGFVTTAAAAGVMERRIAAQTGHAPNSPVLRRYIRHGSVFKENAVTELGL